MKKLIASVLGVTFVAALALTTTAVTTAQLGDANYQGEALFHSFPSSVLLAAGYKQSLDLNQEIRAMGMMAEEIGMFSADAMNEMADALDQVQEVTILVAARDITMINFDDLEENAEDNICIAARMQMSEPLRSEFLEGKPADIMQEDMFGYTYLTTSACLNHQNFNKQSDRIRLLNDAANVDHTFYTFVNKGVLHEQFAKSQLASDLANIFDAESMMEEMYMYDENGDIDMQTKMMLQGFLNTIKRTRLVAMAADSQRLFMGASYKDGMLMSELNVEFANADFPQDMNEIFDGGVRAGKFFLTPEVTVAIQGKHQGKVSYNTVAYSNLDASIFFMGGSNMFFPLMTIGMVGAMTEPSYDDYYYEDDYYYDEDMYYDMDMEDEDMMWEEDDMEYEETNSDTMMDEDFFYVEQ